MNIVAKEEKLKSFKLPNRNSWVKAKLRNASIQWPAKTEAKRLARVSRGIYKCAMCQEARFREKEIQLDHIKPVVGIKEGFTTWDQYIERLLPDVQGYQVLCLSCHSIKTDLENKMRVKLKKSLDKKHK